MGKHFALLFPWPILSYPIVHTFPPSAHLSSSYTLFLYFFSDLYFIPSLFSLLPILDLFLCHCICQPTSNISLTLHFCWPLIFFSVPVLLPYLFSSLLSRTLPAWSAFLSLHPHHPSLYCINTTLKHIHLLLKSVIAVGDKAIAESQMQVSCADWFEQVDRITSYTCLWSQGGE